MADAPDSVNQASRGDPKADAASSSVQHESRGDTKADAPSSSANQWIEAAQSSPRAFEISSMLSDIDIQSIHSYADSESILNDVEIHDELTSSILQKLKNVSPSPNDEHCCIYKVHKKFRTKNEDAYTPELVSIGPFHRDKPALKAMENLKLRYMNKYLSRMKSSSRKLERCIYAIREYEEEARTSYSEPIELDSDQFVQMMIVDGIFIIELFIRSIEDGKPKWEDPIFSNTWGMASLARDLILLENQIPMPVLETIFYTTDPVELRSVEWGASRFFEPMLQIKVDIFEMSSRKFYHLLDFVSQEFHVSRQHRNTKNNLKHVPCATQLWRAGVKFKKGSSSCSLLDIKFIDGVLEIPPLLIQDQTECLLRNLIALEQCCDGYDTYMTSYAFFMDSLIDSSNDVAFLCKNEIIINYLGDNECVSSLFNKLCSEVTLVDYYYSELCDQLNAFYKTRWHGYKATLKRDYFQSPWSGISVAAAALLLLLTLTATIFAILSFAIHKS